MELDFQKEKKKYENLADSELVARLRDPNASATQRMLVEAEIARRGLDRHAPIESAPVEERPTPELVRRGSNLFSTLIIVVIVVSIIAGVLEDMGIDLIELAREWFGDRGTAESLWPSR